MIEIRDATPDDAAAGCEVLRRSITELCAADHGNDPDILARWLGNETITTFAAWADQPDNSLLVAFEGDQILGVGSVSDTGTIGLNYVSPDAPFSGMSRALLRALEFRAAIWHSLRASYEQAIVIKRISPKGRARSENQISPTVPIFADARHE